jgi:hypothetical protein
MYARSCVSRVRIDNRALNTVSAPGIDLAPIDCICTQCRPPLPFVQCQQLTARAPRGGEPSRDREARPRCAGTDSHHPGLARLAPRRTAQAAIGLGLELGDGEAAHVEPSIGYPSPSTSAAYLPSLSTSATYHPSFSTSQAQRCGTSATQSAPARATRASAPTQGGSSLARVRRLVDGRAAGGLRWAAFGGSSVGLRCSAGGWRARRSRGSSVKLRQVGVGAEAVGTGHRKRSSSPRQRSLAGRPTARSLHGYATAPRGPRGRARAGGASQRTRARGGC